MASLPALDAPVVTLHDRRVRLGPPGAPQEAQPSLYRLCRQWVQNEPDLGDPPGPEVRVPRCGGAAAGPWKGGEVSARCSARTRLGHRRPLLSTTLPAATPCKPTREKGWLPQHTQLLTPPLHLSPIHRAQPPSASKLPPLPPVSEEAAEVLRQAAPQQQPLPAPAPAAAPAAGAASAAAEAAGDAATASSSEPPAVDVLLKHHKQHWAAVRQHRRTRAAAAQQRYAQRLQAYMQAGGAVGGAAALPIPMQQG